MNEPSAVATASSPLYAAREEIYPRKVKGTFRRLKWAALIVLLGLYYGAPWLRWDRGAGAPHPALAGRVGCGFTCPQPVWTDLFMWVERLIEGDRPARMALDRAPLSPAKALERTGQH